MPVRALYVCVLFSISDDFSLFWNIPFDIIMDACETYARQWTKKEDVELDTLSEWINSIGEVVKRRIRRLKHSVNIFRDPDVARELNRYFKSNITQLGQNKFAPLDLNCINIGIFDHRQFNKY